MGDAAHGESLDHEVYRTPLAVRPQFESWKTPDNYTRRHTGTDKLPDKMKVWRVQQTGKGVGSVVARGNGFTDSPDAEILALGFNVGKEYGSVGVGRHGNVLQWGYSAPPSQMTEPGRSLFLNCIHYIRRFEGKTPLVRVQASNRRNALALASIITTVVGDKKEFFLRTFPQELWDKYHADPDGLVAYYKANLELVYRDGVYRVDEELRSLGLESNRKVETLERLFELANDETHRETARRLLQRYIAPHTTFDFRNGRDRIYFTDVGGYKFQVVPEGYIANK